jgi:hypothetical protein
MRSSNTTCSPIVIEDRSEARESEREKEYLVRSNPSNCALRPKREERKEEEEDE